MPPTNQILTQSPFPAAARFVYGMPAWGARSMRLAFLVAGGGLLYLANRAATGSAPTYALVLLVAMACCFLLVALRARATVYFLADGHGMYFPESTSFVLFGKSGVGHWLFVPWSNISNIRVTRIRQTDHVSFSVAASAEEERRFFGNLADVKRLLGGNVDKEGNLIAAYANAFMAAEKVVSKLSQLRSAAAY
jgi:hypothetical protein